MPDLAIYIYKNENKKSGSLNDSKGKEHQTFSSININ